MEIEVKVPVHDLAKVRARALDLGYGLVRGRHFEANVLYDYPDRSLSLTGCLLRVRETPEGALFTFKGKVVHDPTFKVRPEVETICTSAQGLASILGNIGLRPFFRYEKYREEFSGEGGLLCLDELPFGHFLELEGTPSSIEALSKALQLEPDTFNKRSYADLYGEHCRKLGVPFGNIVFPTAAGDALP
jgi:adenylate cyclase, class 2